MSIRALFKRKSAVALGGVLAALAMTSAPAFAASAPPSGGAGIHAKGMKVIRITPNSMSVACSTQGAPVECQVIEPTVNQPQTEYPAIEFSPGQHVVVQAGGCVQTGGSGLTWKRYVDPMPASAGRWYGTISIPGATNGLVALSSVIGQSLTVGVNGGPLNLGYVDNGYRDNSYDFHDNGTGNQCLNVENAWVDIFIS
jgi:hypothetical protein